MKTLFSASLALALVAAAQAQTFRSESGRGGRDGNARNEHRDGGRGRDDWDRGGWHGGHSHWHLGSSWRPSVRIYSAGYYPNYGYYGGYGYGYGSYGYYPSYGAYSYYPAYGDAYPYYERTGSSSAAANGLVLGALAGGIIGHNSGEFRNNGWRGAAWGAGAGLLIGSIIDANRRVTAAREQATVVAQPQPVVTASAPPVEQPTIIQRNYGSATPRAVAASPMSEANALFGR